MKTVLITGATSGIGKATAELLARHQYRLIICGRRKEILETLESDLAKHTQITSLVFDVKDKDSVFKAISSLPEDFSKIDILINNASAINLTRTDQTPAKRFDLMFDVNVRGTFLTSQAALPHLRKSAAEGRNPHILNLSPPLSMKSVWFKNHVAYTMAKYGMSMCVLGMAEEFKRDGIGVNALWPRTVIDTAALQMIPGIDASAGRTPEILADAAYIIFNRDAKECTGNFFVDDLVLESEGITDLEKYSVTPGTKDFLLDFFLD